MAVKISGVLKDGTGKPVQNCTIQLKAKRNSTTVVVNTLASENPDEAGRYSMDVEYGQYSVILLVEGFPPSHAGTITVYEDSRPGTLNDFLGAMSEDDVTYRRHCAVLNRWWKRWRVTLRRRRRMPERRRRPRGMPAYQPVRQKRALQMLTLQQGRHRSQPGRRQKVQPQQSSQRMRPRPRLLRPLKKPVSHHKVQQKLNCQERRQKVQPVMQPRDATTATEKARESAESAQSAEQSRIAAEEAVNRIPHRGGTSRAKGGNRGPAGPSGAEGG